MGESWDGTLEEWVVSEGYCYAAGMAQLEDGMYYAAAPVEGEAGWGFIYKDDHEEDILQDDGETTKKITISESVALKTLMDTGKAPTGGLWLAGNKYQVPQYKKDEEIGEYTFVWAFASKPKMGVHIVSTGSQIVAGYYSEEKGQNSGNCKKAVLAFAEYLKGIGY